MTNQQKLAVDNKLSAIPNAPTDANDLNTAVLPVGNRRQFLGSAVRLLAVATAPMVGAEPPKNQPVPAPLPKLLTPQKALENALLDIPKDLAKITIVEPSADNKALLPGTKKEGSITVVHLQQLHGNNGTIDVSQLPPEIVAAARKYLPLGQKQQGEILEILLQKAGVKEVHLESMPPATLDYYNDIITKLRGNEGLYLKIILEKTKTETPEELRKFLQDNKNSSDPLVNLLQEQAERTWIPLMKGRQKIASDFTLRAAYEGRVKILASESPRLHQKAVEMVRKNPTITTGAGGDPEFNKLQNQRDEFLLSKVVEAGKPVSVVVLGAGHSLRDEVAAHNKAHPNKPIRLIEILPEAAEKFLKIAETE